MSTSSVYFILLHHSDTVESWHLLLVYEGCWQRNNLVLLPEMNGKYYDTPEKSSVFVLHVFAFIILSKPPSPW